MTVNGTTGDDVDRASIVERAVTFLFVPGTRDDRFDKAVASGADAVIIDLEDTVGAEDKDVARSRAGAWLATGGRAAVRVNPVGSPWFANDVRVAADALAVVLPKAECARDVERVVEAAGGRVPIIPLIESPRGLLAAAEICAVPGVVRLGFGNVDFAAEIGVEPGCHEALLTARSGIVHASSATGRAAPVDGVTTDLGDAGRVEHDAAHARRLGFTGKLLVHPGQVEPAVSVLVPTEAEVAWARAVLASASSAVGVFEGQLVDEPVLARARRLLARVNAEPGRW
ncbi:HpcH/HpaI aldolase/citrate lyase family protein [Nocardioides sp. J54]|uniref:HpcH/HpaI aldolase/citrate lyase family protein n=1 Tax=Nocardioides sp. J54 TaxID=935866 RepID=UPI0004B22D5C|nr:CoA ester lyase [Nocardioides sp. J54]